MFSVLRIRILREPYLEPTESNASSQSKESNPKIKVDDIMTSVTIFSYQTDNRFTTTHKDNVYLLCNGN